MGEKDEYCNLILEKGVWGFFRKGEVFCWEGREWMGGEGLENGF